MVSGTHYVESEHVAFILPPWSIAHFIDLRELILKFKSHCSENPKPLGAEHAKNEWNHFLPFSKFYFSNYILCCSVLFTRLLGIAGDTECISFRPEMMRASIMRKQLELFQWFLEKTETNENRRMFHSIIGSCHRNTSLCFLGAL